MAGSVARPVALRGASREATTKAFARLEALVEARFAWHVACTERAARAPAGSTPRHRVRFSKRITTSWALIYFRRHEIRLSPYVFLLDARDLKHGTHWRELDATLAHEAVHAFLWARDRDGGHSVEFHRLYAALGQRANGDADLGPPNVAYRYVYHCASCGREWPRRAPLAGNWSCGGCSPGRYSKAHLMTLRERLRAPWERLAERLALVHEAAREGEAIARGRPAK